MHLPQVDHQIYCPSTLGSVKGKHKHKVFSQRSLSMYLSSSIGSKVKCAYWKLSK